MDTLISQLTAKISTQDETVQELNARLDWHTKMLESLHKQLEIIQLKRALNQLYQDIVNNKVNASIIDSVALETTVFTSILNICFEVTFLDVQDPNDPKTQKLLNYIDDFNDKYGFLVTYYKDIQITLTANSTQQILENIQVTLSYIEKATTTDRLIISI